MMKNSTLQKIARVRAMEAKSFSIGMRIRAMAPALQGEEQHLQYVD